jgi:hypothetical protein
MKEKSLAAKISELLSANQEYHQLYFLNDDEGISYSELRMLKAQIVRDHLMVEIMEILPGFSHDKLFSIEDVNREIEECQNSIRERELERAEPPGTLDRREKP